jgi:hypothetical protein
VTTQTSRDWFLSLCSCGWRGPEWRTTEHNANNDHAFHMAFTKNADERHEPRIKNRAPLRKQRTNSNPEGTPMPTYNFDAADVAEMIEAVADNDGNDVPAIEHDAHGFTVTTPLGYVRVGFILDRVEIHEYETTEDSGAWIIGSCVLTGRHRLELAATVVCDLLSRDY